jgi:ABC-2 type transport system ATP-binding protein
LVKTVDGAKSVIQTEQKNDEDVQGSMEVLISVEGKKEIRPLLVKKLIENNVDLYEMSIQRNSLEDVFHALTTEKTEEKSDGK